MKRKTNQFSPDLATALNLLAIQEKIRKAAQAHNEAAGPKK